MATYTKTLLSGSANGQLIALPTTASSVATPIHTSVSGTSSFDEIYIYASNPLGASSILTLLWGSTSSLNQILTSVPSQAGRILVCDGMLLNNGLTVSAYASVSGSLFIDGFVNRIQ